jgi:phytoene dehydrogenase-like protein
VSWDAVVIGAGVNGLTAAAYLARAGRRVVVLERRAAPDDTPIDGWVPPRVFRELALGRRGLEVEAPDPWIAAPLPAGGRLELARDPRQAAAAIATLSPGDARRWPEFCKRMRRLAGFLEALYLASPPRPIGSNVANLARLAALGRRFRGLGKTGMVDLLRILPMSAAELLDEWFESDTLKGVLGAAAVRGVCQGPRSGGTAFVLLHHHVGAPAGVFRQPLVTPGAFAVAARALGTEIRYAAEVTRVTLRGDRATGVALGSGEEVAAPLVLSSADPQRTFLHMIDPTALDPEFVRAVGHIKLRGATARVTVTLSHPTAAVPLCLATGLDALERAYDDAKYGRISACPLLEAWAAPRGAGRHRLVIHVQYTPYRLEDGGWSDARGAALADLAVHALDEHVPGLAEHMVDHEVLTPVDFEERCGVTQGALGHGELTLDQILFMRPVPGWAHYRTPVRGLYLCGAGAHPGPGVLGGPGRLAARAALKD